MRAQITVNGKPVSLEEAETVGDIVARTLTKAGGARTDRGIAVAVNHEVLPRSTWSSSMLQVGDRVEIITAVQGG